MKLFLIYLAGEKVAEKPEQHWLPRLSSSTLNQQWKSYNHHFS